MAYQIYKQKFKEEYNRLWNHRQGWREKLGLIFWRGVGEAAPIITIKYAISGFTNRSTTLEILSWLGALAANYMPLIFKSPPLHLYGGYAGIHIHDLRASVKRNKKSQSTNQVIQNLESVVNDTESEEQY